MTRWRRRLLLALLFGLPVLAELAVFALFLAIILGARG
jgi:hypothetical protein